MEKIKTEDILEYKYLSGLDKQKDNNLFSFVISKVDEKENKYKQSLYLSDGINHRLLYNFSHSTNYHHYDDNTFIVTEKEEDKHVLLFIDIESKEVIKKIILEHAISSLKFIDKDKIIYSTYHNPQKENYDEKLFEIIETIPFQSNGAGFTQGKFSQLFLMDLNTQITVELSSSSENVMTFELNDDKSILFYTSIENSGKLTFYPNLYQMDLDTLEKNTCYENGTLSIGNIIPLKDKIYVTASSLKEHGINQNNDFYQVSNNELILVTQFGLSANNSIGSDVRYGGSKNSHIYNDKYYFVGTYHKYNRIYSFDGEEISVFYESKGSIDGWHFINNHTIRLISLQNNALQEIYELDFDKNSHKKITKINDQALKNKYIGLPKHISFVSDGYNLDGWIIYPKDFDKSKTYPAILDIHGGPKTIYSDVFYHEMQHWASEGYFVFFCNPRGGDAYDNEFADIRGKYGTIDYQDIMVFTDHVLNNYPIEKNKVGVTGGSYGGFMTNWIVSHTDRFAAAATQRSISNWISFYGTSDIGYYFASDQTDANPYGKLEEMWEQSPLKHAKNIKTPLLFIHSDKDYRCPIEQAMQLYTVVKEQNVDTRFVWFKDENHDLSRTGRPLGRMKRLDEITNWMNKYLK